jgi:uncharacterized membrane protein YccC
MNANQIVAILLDEAFVPDYTEPEGRNYGAEVAELEQTVKTRQAIQQAKEDAREAREKAAEKARLKDEERRAGLETEREMEKEQKQSLQRSRYGGPRYWHKFERTDWPKMREYKVGSVTGQPVGPAKSNEPSLQIKGVKSFFGRKKPASKPAARQMPFRFKKRH